MNEFIEEIFKSLQKIDSNESPVGKKYKLNDMSDLIGMFKDTPFVQNYDQIYNEILKNMPNKLGSNGKDNIEDLGPLIQCCKKVFKNIQPSPKNENPVDSNKNPNVDAVVLAPSKNVMSCPVDIREMETYVTYKFDLPGIAKSDITINVNSSNILTVTADRSNMYTISSDKFLLKERYCGIIKRDLKLPTYIDISNPNALYVDGVLTIKFNKVTDSNNSIKILIS